MQTPFAPATIQLPDVEHFPWEEVRSVLAAVHAAPNGGPDQVAAAATWLASEIDWRAVIPGPVGEAIEVVDDLAPKVVLLLAKLHPFRRRGR